MTGRYAIRSGNHSVPLGGEEGGLVSWEKTMGDILSQQGYATACFGKWHIGASEGRWPTDHGFDEWYGIPRTWDESLWGDDPWYVPERDGVSYVLEGVKGQSVDIVQPLTLEVRRDIDQEFLKRSRRFVERALQVRKPFFLYFNHSLMHFPTIPRKEFKGKSGQGDWADCLLELDADFQSLLEMLKEFGVEDNTIVVLSGDNGPEEFEPWRGHSGFFDGSYFTGMEGSLRTPCIVRYPGRVPKNQQSNEIVHITDMFTTLLSWAGSKIPKDREIDGVDQRSFFEGRQKNSSREGFPYWMGETLYGIKWRDFKLVFYLQRTLTEAPQKLATPHLVNLIVDPKERKAVDFPYLHSWAGIHHTKILNSFLESVQREPLIPAGAPLGFVPHSNTKREKDGTRRDAEL